LNGLQSPPGPSGCEQEKNAPLDVEPAGAVKFRIAGETNGSPYDAYEAQLRLLVRVLPLLGRQDRLALKGGTAINLFVQDLPRLSVDINLGEAGRP
jgi:Nucleotidyl transferase AbiEii toxin, Type IV TA system